MWAFNRPVGQATATQQLGCTQGLTGVGRRKVKALLWVQDRGTTVEEDMGGDVAADLSGMLGHLDSSTRGHPDGHVLWNPCAAKCDVCAWYV